MEQRTFCIGNRGGNKVNILTVKETSKILGITDSRVKQLIESGKLSAKKFGLRNWMVNHKSVEKYIIEKTGGKING